MEPETISQCLACMFLIPRSIIVFSSTESEYFGQLKFALLFIRPEVLRDPKHPAITQGNELGRKKPLLQGSRIRFSHAKTTVKIMPNQSSHITQHTCSRLETCILLWALRVFSWMMIFAQRVCERLDRVPKLTNPVGANIPRGRARDRYVPMRKKQRKKRRWGGPRAQLFSKHTSTAVVKATAAERNPRAKKAIRESDTRHKRQQPGGNIWSLRKLLCRVYTGVLVVFGGVKPPVTGAEELRRSRQRRR